MNNTVNVPREVIVLIANQIREQAECSEFNLVQSGSNPDAARIALGHFYRIANQLSDMLAAAPKVERKPCYECGSKTFISTADIHCACATCNPELLPAPSSDELLEALEKLTSSIKCVAINGPKDRSWGMGSNLPKHYDAAIAAIAKHKGPQS